MHYASTLRSLYAPYLVATGVWSLAHRRSFERVTGPKEDYWLVQTVGALAIAIGASLGVAVRRRAQEPETIVLGAASCIAFVSRQCARIPDRIPCVPRRRPRGDRVPRCLARTCFQEGCGAADAPA